MSKARDVEPKPPEQNASSGQSGPPEPNACPKTQAYCAAMDMIAEGTRKLCDAGMNGTEAGKIAADIFCKCCD